MIEPVQKNDALLADIESAKHDSDTLHIWWLGQSGFLIQWRGRHLLMDPYLSDSLTRKYAATDRPHVRMTSRPIDPVKLGFVDVITSSHNHTDHLDAEAILPIHKANPRVHIIVAEANIEFAAERLGVLPERLLSVDDGTSVEVAGFRVTGVASAHEELSRDESGHYNFLGFVVQCGPWLIYHSGDTVRYPDMEKRLKPYGLDVAILPINGRRPLLGVAGNLDGPGAARLAHDIGAKLVIPCHFEMFEFNTASPDDFVATAASLKQPIAVLKCGEHWRGRK